MKGWVTAQEALRLLGVEGVKNESLTANWHLIGMGIGPKDERFNRLKDFFNAEDIKRIMIGPLYYMTEDEVKLDNELATMWAENIDGFDRMVPQGLAEKQAGKPSQYWIMKMMLGIARRVKSLEEAAVYLPTILERVEKLENNNAKLDKLGEELAAELKQ
jgi:hypothetical protein